MVDADGVALAAIQGLAQVVEEKTKKISALETELAALRAELAGQKASNQRWEERLQAPGSDGGKMMTSVVRS